MAFDLDDATAVLRAWLLDLPDRWTRRWTDEVGPWRSGLPVLRPRRAP